jgi:hypothetical protein
MMKKFLIDEKELDMNLFTYEAPKNGPQTTLNVNYLPHLMSYIVYKLSRKE